MKNKRILLISIPVIIIISAVIGCVITFSSAPHAALARVFIDIGALFALISITYSLPKPEPIHIDDIVDGLRDLARNRFDRRLPIKEQDELHQIRQAFNELAGTLSDSRDPSLTHIRYNPMNRLELKVTPLPNVHHNINHSHHPELGQVKSAADEIIASARTVSAPSENLAREMIEPEIPEPIIEKSNVVESSEPVASISSASADTMMPEEHPFSAHMLASEPPISETSKQDFETESELESEAIVESTQKPQPELKSEPLSRRPESYPSGIGAADLFFLFERFKAAHEQPTQNIVDFDSFMSTVNSAREELIRSYQCKDVKFEVVTEAGAVALRPRLIR